jgi:ATP:ADP antiporter, AAA family
MPRLLRIERHELAAVGWAFGYFFCLLCSYYILRPVRDTAAVQIGPERLRVLFTVTFIVMVLLVPVFGWLASRLPRQRLLPLLYAFFVVNLLAFSADFAPLVFFVWLSVFNLFAVSLFWSYMADVYRTEQAARLYGVIAAGGSCGAIAGPLIASVFAGIGNPGLLLMAAAILALTLPCIYMLNRWSRRFPRETTSEQPIGGTLLAGARAALSSPFLLLICGYLLCYTVLSTALYFQQVEIVRAAVPDPAARTRLFANVDLAVNTLTLLLQVLAFSRLTAMLGPGWLLALMPIVSVAGFLWLGATPTLAALIVFGVTRRTGEFAISKPAREALFTIVPREQRYKAKNFIDTVIYRGGDALAGWLFASAHAFLAAGVAAGWTAIAFWLGARMKSWTRDDARSSPSLRAGLS